MKQGTIGQQFPSGSKGYGAAKAGAAQKGESKHPQENFPNGITNRTYKACNTTKPQRNFPHGGK